MSRRVVLRLSDENAYALLNAPKDVLDERSAPGRAIVDGFETQIAVLGGTPNVAEQTKLLTQWAQDLRAAGAREVEEIGWLPTRLQSIAMPDRIGDSPALGVAEDTLAARDFDPIGTFVVTGPPLSGKTNAMKALITSMTRFDPACGCSTSAGVARSSRSSRRGCAARRLPTRRRTWRPSSPTWSATSRWMRGS